MKTVIKGWIEDDDRKWVAATVALENGEVYHSPADYGRKPHADDPANYCDTSDHITVYLNGEWRVNYPGHPPVVITGLSVISAAQILTGDKHKYPNKAHIVHCIQAGEVFFLIPKGIAQPDLDYSLLLPGEFFTPPKAGWAIILEGSKFPVVETNNSTIEAFLPTLVFWEK